MFLQQGKNGKMEDGTDPGGLDGRRVKERGAVGLREEASKELRQALVLSFGFGDPL